MHPDFLIVGDPHIQIQKLDEGKRALSEIVRLVRKLRPRTLLILGDAFHTMAVIRSEVLSAWGQFFSEIEDVAGGTRILILVGNHDMAGPNGGTHSMEVFKAFPGVAVIDSPYLEADGIAYFPFMRDKGQFEAECLKLPPGTILFCHQSFDGAQFENGFYDPHGASTAAADHLGHVISGHVHRRQQVKNITYPGTPYQMNFADAGESKGIFLGQRVGNQIALSEPVSLGLPEYHVIERDAVSELAEALPIPVAQDSYRLIASGTPQEIDVFMKSQQISDFRSKVRRLDNGLRAVREAGKLEQVRGHTLIDKVTSFVALQNWKVDRDRLVKSAGRLLAD
jgi:DNA repair exonuclease SbcCD nuclease subunit